MTMAIVIVAVAEEENQRVVAAMVGHYQVQRQLAVDVEGGKTIIEQIMPCRIKFLIAISTGGS